MLDNWLQPVDYGRFSPQSLAPWQLGRHTRIFGDSPSALEGARVALLGLEPAIANAMRIELYALSFPFDGLILADLGNARRQSVSFLSACLKELFDSDIIPILLGGEPEGFLAAYRAFQQVRPLVSLAVVDERIRLGMGEATSGEGNYLDVLFAKKQARPFHLSFMGCQTHFTDPAVFSFLDRHHIDYVRLGKARANLSELEPLTRDADLLSLHLGALKHCDAPDAAGNSPSGFFTEEACQISRYAGMSDKLRAFGLFGLHPGAGRQTVQTAAQIIWYFLDGFHHRKNDFPASAEGLMEYIVELKKLDYQLTFWKSAKSGRWWLQVPVKTNKKQQRHRLIPCSYHDYKMAGQEEISERLLNAFKRFT
jgi:formiminoglutamase